MSHPRIELGSNAWKASIITTRPATLNINSIPPVGIEPTIFRLEGGRLSHLAKGA